jgi:large subunit ribosomal protein L10
MAKTKKQKKEIIQTIKEYLAKQRATYFVDFKKFKAKDLFELRQELKKNNSLLLVVKKTLADLVFKEKGVKVDFENMEGQLALAFGFEDEISPARTLYRFQEKKGLPEILGGLWQNEFIDKQKVIEIAKLPSKKELFANLVSCLKSQQYMLINALEHNIKGLVFILKQKAEKHG